MLRAEDLEPHQVDPDPPRDTRWTLDLDDPYARLDLREPATAAPYGPYMDQRVSLITLGTSDLPRAKSFYEQLGWRGQEVEETVFFQADGLALVLWSRAKLAEDAGVDDRTSSGFGGIVLAHNVRSDVEVDDLLTTAEAAGATVTRRAAPTFYGGYAGCFADPDGHVWEIAHNPGFPLADDGSLTVPELS